MAETLAAPCVDVDADDERLVRTLEEYDEYLVDQQHAIELLKQGFLKLTMAKMNLPAHAVGELSFKDEFESALYVTEESNGTLTTVKAADRETSLRVQSKGEAAHPQTVKRRKDKSASDQGAAKVTAIAEAPAPKAPPTSTANQEDAAIMWFSSLPPQNLRVAQKNFRSALHALLVSAASARKIQAAVQSTDAPTTAS